MKKKSLALLSLILAAVLLLSGCSGDGEKKEESKYSLQIMVAAPYVSDERIKTLESELNTALPQLSADSKTLSVQSVSMGDGKTDPMMMVGATTRIAGMFATKEIDLLICDADNARRYGENGETYVPLDTLFTKEEQEELGVKPACVPIMDDEGNDTGEMSAPCGVDLTECEAVKRLLGSGYSAYVITEQENIENAKAAIRYLLTAE